MANPFNYDLAELPIVRPLLRGWALFRLRGERGNSARTLLFLDLAEAVGLGVPLDQALELIAQGPESEAAGRGVRFLARNLLAPVRQGFSLSHALGRLGRVFSRQEILIVQMGEQYGMLTQALRRLADYSHTDQRLRRIRAYMTYPLTIAALAVILVSFILVFIIPKFQDMYSQLGGELPALTRTLIGISRFALDRLPFSLTGLAVLILLFYMIGSVVRRRTGIPLIFHFPIVGGLYRSVRDARWLAAFTLHLEAGVAADLALAHAGEITGGELEQRSRAAAALVAGGGAIGEACLRCGVLEPWIGHRLHLIDWRGNYIDNVRGIVQDADRRVTGVLERFGQRSEVFYIVAVGIAVGFTAIAIYLPLFRISSLIAQQ